MCKIQRSRSSRVEWGGHHQLLTPLEDVWIRFMNTPLFLHYAQPSKTGKKEHFVPPFICFPVSLALHLPVWQSLVRVSFCRLWNWIVSWRIQPITRRGGEISWSPFRASTVTVTGEELVVVIKCFQEIMSALSGNLTSRDQETRRAKF